MSTNRKIIRWIIHEEITKMVVDNKRNMSADDVDINKLSNICSMRVSKLFTINNKEISSIPKNANYSDFE